jgi:ATP phosphoribosyltransferase
VWFQRASDVVRKLRTGDLDLGIVGTDMCTELGDGDDDLVVCHEALGFGQCHLALGVPMTGAGREGMGEEGRLHARRGRQGWVYGVGLSACWR